MSKPQPPFYNSYFSSRLLAEVALFFAIIRFPQGFILFSWHIIKLIYQHFINFCLILALARIKTGLQVMLTGIF